MLSVGNVIIENNVEIGNLCTMRQRLQILPLLVQVVFG